MPDEYCLLSSDVKKNSFLTINKVNYFRFPITAELTCDVSSSRVATWIYYWKIESWNISIN